jgi:hypothetical protein
LVMGKITAAGKRFATGVAACRSRMAERRNGKRGVLA